MNKNNQLISKIDNYGNKYWYLYGLLHREDGPAIEWVDGDKSWYHHGYLHRLNGSAVEKNNGDKYWYFRDQLHRLDGPAVEQSNGYKSWWYYGKRIDCTSQEEFERLIKLKWLW